MCACINVNVVCVCIFVRRRSVARRQRETRRSTQPVPTDLLQRIKQSDAVEEKELEESLGGSGTTNAEPKVVMKQNDTSPEEKITPVEDPSTSKTKAEEIDSQGKGTVVIEQEEKKGGGEKVGLPVPLQSAYKPANRPASKLISDEEEVCHVIISETLSTEPPPSSTTVQDQPQQQLLTPEGEKSLVFTIVHVD